MKIGDVVKFHTSGWVFNHARARYENPGVVIEDCSGRMGHTPSYRVLWADKKMTVEHVSYLERMKDDESR